MIVKPRFNRREARSPGTLMAAGYTFTELKLPGSPNTTWFFMACVSDAAPVEGARPQVYVLRRKLRTMEEALEHARIIAVRWNRLLARSMLRERRN